MLAIRRRREAGFSLIEIMIVLALVATLVTVISSKINRNDNRAIRKNIHAFSSQVRDLRNKARMRNLTYRLVINLPENEDEQQSYWVESTGKQFLVTYDEDALKKQKDEIKEGKKDPSGFEIDSEISKNGPQPLPKGLYFESVEILAQKKEYTSGRIYIHFFPEGRVEEAVIHITNRDKLHWSLAIHPLTGQVDLIDHNKKLKDMKTTEEN
jgi:prepilin-type N-terminal cleavage/methylation domain-containing protein